MSDNEIRTKEEIKSLVNRLNRLEGQIRGVKRMIENGEYCLDIMIQTEAICQAIKSLNCELLKTHIETTLVEEIKDNDFTNVSRLVKSISKL